MRRTLKITIGWTQDPLVKKVGFQRGMDQFTETIEVDLPATLSATEIASLVFSTTQVPRTLDICDPLEQREIQRVLRETEYAKGYAGAAERRYLGLPLKLGDTVTVHHLDVTLAVGENGWDLVDKLFDGPDLTVLLAKARGRSEAAQDLRDWLDGKSERGNPLLTEAERRGAEKAVSRLLSLAVNNRD